MSLARLLAAGVPALLAFLALDAAWLVLVAADLFRRELGPLLREVPGLYPAAGFYLIHTAAMLKLAIAPALERRSIGVALGNGAMLGLAAYAAFDLTALAIIKGWPVRLAVLDIAWGTCATALASAAGFLAGRRLCGGDNASSRP